MLRFLMMASVMALGCTTMVPPAQAQSREKLPAVASGQQTNRVTSRQFDLDHHRPPDHRQRHHHFGPLVPFGFFDGFDSSAAPAVAEPPSSEFDAPSPGATRLDADRPPCHETTPQGVEILRGNGCSRAAH